MIEPYGTVRIVVRESKAMNIAAADATRLRDNRTYVVTGATSGIGAATVRTFKREAAGSSPAALAMRTSSAT